MKPMPAAASDAIKVLRNNMEEILSANALEARGMAPLVGDPECTKTCARNRHRIADIDCQVSVQILLTPHLAIVEREHHQLILGCPAHCSDVTVDLRQFLRRARNRPGWRLDR